MRLPRLRLGLRARILLFTALPIAALAIATLAIVNRGIARTSHEAITQDLRRASAVLENLLGARARGLTVATQVTVQDPKFFSVLTIPGAPDDPQLRATLSGVARDFNAILAADVFEIVNADGHVVASVARDRTDASRAPFVESALGGRAASGILAHEGALHQIQVTPVVAGGRIVGALLVGLRLGRALADELRELTRSEVTFVSNGAPIATTLDVTEDRASLLAEIDRHGRDPNALRSGVVTEIASGGHQRLTLVRNLPATAPGERQHYAMQRALDVETAYVRHLQTILVEIGVVALFVALLAGFVIAEGITQPVSRLVRGAEEMERGNYDYPLQVKRADEIGALARRFEDMRERQRAYVSQLKEVARVKTEFIDVASHELRTPISVIRGFLELLAEERLGAANERQRQAYEAIDRSVGTLERIADDATRMAQLEDENLRLQRLDQPLEPVVRRAVAYVRERAAQRRVEIATEIEPGLRAWVDGARVGEAIACLVSNGVRFTPDGGRVEVRARAVRGTLVVAVADTGIGIDPERVAQLSERAASGRDPRHHHSSSSLEFESRGLGLGLAIARAVAEAHGGRLAIESAPGRGSTFTLRLPMTEDAIHAEAA